MTNFYEELPLEDREDSILQYVPPMPRSMGSSSLELEEALEHIEEFRNYAPGWDGEGSLGFSPVTVANARTAIKVLLSVLPSPEIFPNANGTISIEWECDLGFASIEIGKTQYSLVVLSPEHKPLLLEDGEVSKITRILARRVAQTLYPQNNRYLGNVASPPGVTWINREPTHNSTLYPGGDRTKDSSMVISNGQLAF